MRTCYFNFFFGNVRARGVIAVIIVAIAALSCIALLAADDVASIRPRVITGDTRQSGLPSTTPIALPKTVSESPAYPVEELPEQPPQPEPAATEEPEESADDATVTDVQLDPGIDAAGETVPAEMPLTSEAQSIQPAATETPAISAPRAPRQYPISGEVEMKFQSSSSSGDEIGYLSQNGLLYFNDKFQQNTRLRINRMVTDGIKISGSFIDLPYQDPDFYLTAESSRTRASLGTVQGEFRAGPMTAIRKQIQGFDIIHKTGPFTFGAVISREKSNTSAESFKGRNIRGPYALRSTSVLEGSERVSINGAAISPSEYTIDYFLGQITFARNIDLTETVDISYESILVVSSNTGSFNGVSAKFSPRGANYELGAAYLEEGMSRTGTYITSEESETFATPATTINLAHGYIKTQSETVAVLTASSTIYLGRITDYSIDYYSGAVTFTSGSVIPSGASVRVNYYHYNRKYLQRIENEEIRGNGESQHTLVNERIYPGPETVFLFINGVQHRQLFPGDDYEIIESSNSILFRKPEVTPDDSFSRHVEISYEIVPATNPGESGSKRTVSDYSGAIRLGRLALAAEHSQTTARATVKTAQVLEERVAVVTDPAKRDYLLQFNPISGTEEIFFNDTISSVSRKYSGTDYVIVNDASANTTTVHFNSDLPAGTMIIANYRYAPVDISEEDKTGAATRLTAAFNTGSLALSGELIQKDLYFSPMTSYNDLELSRIIIAAKLTPSGRPYTLAATYRDSTSAGGFDTDVEFDTSEITSTLTYALGRGRSFTYQFGLLTTTDNRAEHLTDTERTSHTLTSHIPLNRANTLSADTSIEIRDLTSNTTVAAGQQNTDKYGIVLNYAPSGSLNLKVSADTNEVDITPATGSATITSTTDSNVIVLSWLPTRVWTVNVRSDTQEIEDSRGPAYAWELHKISAGAFSQPMGRFKTIALTFDRQDKPSHYQDDTRSDSAALRLSYIVSPDWLLSPSYAVTTADVQLKSSTSNTTAAIRADFKKESAKGWNGALEYGNTQGETTRFDSNAIPTTTCSEQNKADLYVNYLRDRYKSASILSFIRNPDGTSTSDKNIFTSTFDYFKSEKTTLAILFRADETPASNILRTTYQLSAKRELNERFRLSLTVKHDRNSDTESKSYSGTLFNMSLTMKF